VQLFGTKGQKFLNCFGTKGQAQNLAMGWDGTGRDNLSKSGTGRGKGQLLFFCQNPGWYAGWDGTITIFKLAVRFRFHAGRAELLRTENSVRRRLLQSFFRILKLLCYFSTYFDECFDEFF
jgi:hypothetical protein